jgi:hypothetical protein
MHRVNNGRVNTTSNGYENMGPAIAIAPIGSAPTLSFDFNAGTVPGGVPDEEPWVYEPPANRAAVFDRDDIYALPPPDHRHPTRPECFAKTRSCLSLSMS